MAFFVLPAYFQSCLGFIKYLHMLLSVEMSRVDQYPCMTHVVDLVKPHFAKQQVQAKWPLSKV